MLRQVRLEYTRRVSSSLQLDSQTPHGHTVPLFASLVNQRTTIAVGGSASVTTGTHNRKQCWRDQA